MTQKFLDQLSRALNTPEAASELKALCNALSGDIVLERSAGRSRSAATGAWSETFDVFLRDSAGNVMTWYNGTQSSKASAGDTSTAGTATIGSAHLVFVNGRAKVTINGSNHAWVAAETATITIASLTVNGVTVTGGTIVVTIA